MSDAVQVVQERNEVVVPLPQMDAQRLDQRIRLMAKTTRESFEKVGRLLDEAKRGDVHVVLGFKSWPAYVSDALGGQLQLSGDARQAMVGLMYGEGMSERAIAQATGASKSTVHRDIEQVVHSGPPEESEGVAAQQDDSTPVETGESGSLPETSPQTTTLDGKSFKRQPSSKAKGVASPAVPRKVVERIAPRLDGLVMALDGLDPNEVDGDAVRDKVDTIRESIGKLTTFVDKVSPPKSPTEDAADNDAGRKVQIPTALRAEAKMLGLTLKLMTSLTADPRWTKSVERFNRKDRMMLDTYIADLQKVRLAMGELYNTTATDSVVSPSESVEPPASVTPASAVPSRPSPSTMPRRTTVEGV